jgi:hypothetical protein
MWSSLRVGSAESPVGESDIPRISKLIKGDGLGLLGHRSYRAAVVAFLEKRDDAAEKRRKGKDAQVDAGRSDRRVGGSRSTSTQ